MKILHLADLHFGKSLHALSLIDSGDQKYWADKTIEIIKEERPQAVVIAGDVYDRGVPTREAVQLFSGFLTRIAREEGIPVLITAGNHDGGERLEFANEILKDSHVYIAGTVSKEMMKVTLWDEYGPVHFWLMPFVFPAAVRTALETGEDEISSYTEAVRRLLAEQPIDFSQRNVLVAHQMVMHGGCEPEHSDSESAVGGVGGIDSTVFEGFDYVALGHIHGAQKVGSERIRYAGAPLCYHFSEAGQKKGLLFVTVGPKGRELQTETVTFAPLHRVRATVTGTLEEILRAERETPSENEYIRVELTDDPVPEHAREQLAAVFETHGSRLLDLTAVRRMHRAEERQTRRAGELSPFDFFEQFYEEQKGAQLSGHDRELLGILSGQVLEHGDRTQEELEDILISLLLEQEGGK